MRARLVPVLLALAVAAGGCSDGEDPGAGPTLSPITESPSLTTEAVPSQATAATPEGASEFVRFWFETLNEAAESGDTKPLVALSDPACETCSRFIEAIDSLYKSGGRIEGGQFTLTSVEAQEVAAGAEEARAFVVYDVTATRQVGSQNETLTEIEALQGETGDLVLRRSADGWLLKEFA